LKPNKKELTTIHAHALKHGGNLVSSNKKAVYIKRVHCILFFVIDGNLSSLGLFIRISFAEINTMEVLPLYYARQQIEQVFDIAKNYADILPLRVHGEDTFRGHLLLCFIATIICKRLQGSWTQRA
jgi:transposase